MLKYVSLFLFFFINNLFAFDFVIIDITSEPVFNYFASLQFWLLIVISPMLLVISLIRYFRKGF